MNDIKSIKALAKLNSLDRSEYYDFYNLNDMELYSNYSELDVELENYFKPEALEDNSVHFKAFANARDGGEFAIWFEENSSNPSAVIFFDSDYEVFLLATSMESFLCKIAHGNQIYATSENWSKLSTMEYEELAQSHDGITTEEMEELLSKELEKFLASVNKSYECNKSDEEAALKRLKEKLGTMTLY